MSRFFSKQHKDLRPYTPGEQPRERRYIKLNTNESPFPPSPRAQAAAAEAAARLQLYPDPTCRALHQALGERFGVTGKEVLVTNGSDEILNFAFMAFCDSDTPALFPDITYGFYEVFADLYHIPHRKIPLGPDLSVDIADYMDAPGTVFLANPNAPTGIALDVATIEKLVASNRDRVVVIDEAYVDFGGESCVPLIHRYDNLLVTQTFSKSRSMAGARLGVGIGQADLLADLNAIKYATNPYNINSMTMAAGLGVLADEDYTRENCAKIIENRTYLAKELKKMGFDMPPSLANFLFVRHARIDGEHLYTRLREKGILVRHFHAPRLSAYNRITIGSRADMETLVATLQTILEEEIV